MSLTAWALLALNIALLMYFLYKAIRWGEWALLGVAIVGGGVIAGSMILLANLSER